MIDDVATGSDDTDECRACGLSSAPAWDTADGRVRLCPPCAAMHGIGCP
ncbi:hypothetical protein [Ilumatobacter sp.]